MKAEPVLRRWPVAELEGAPDWALGLVATLPDELTEPGGDAARALVQSLRLLRAFTESPPTSSRLPFSYHLVPAWARKTIARIIGLRLRRRAEIWARFPGWPCDLSADVLADFLGVGRPLRLDGRTPIVLSHDLDSPEGLRNAVELFLPLEEAVGARSTNFLVPKAWPIDRSLLAEIHRRGHEIGIHGYNHANRTPFAAAEERKARLEAALPLIKEFAITGYRAPSLVRTRRLLDELPALYTYDSSIPTSGGPFPVPNNGCATARPFRLGGLVELPLSLPRDGSLLFMGYEPRQILALWQDCALLIARSGGVVVLLTHCEARFSGNVAMLSAYRAFLDWLGESGQFTFVTAAQAVSLAQLAP